MNLFLCSAKVNSLISYIFGSKFYPLNVIAFFAAGIKYKPEFLIGMKYGALLSIPVILFNSLKDKETIINACCLEEDPTTVIITAPIIEEIEFRYLLNNGITHILSPFLDMDDAKTLSISLVASLFGINHLGLYS